MTLRTSLRGGRLAQNRNTTVSLKVATQVKGGKLAANHNTTVR